jgi:hypothetical protein
MFLRSQANLFAGLGLAIFFGASLLAGTERGTHSGEQPGTASSGKLFKNHYELIAQARLRGEKSVVVLVAARRGENSQVAREVTRLGGEVHFRADEVDYLRARMPVEKIPDLAKSENVQSLDIDVDPDKFDPTLDFPSDDKPTPSSVPPDPDTPLSHPYLPEADMDIDAFRASHPTFDGRGVTLAILDATPDMLLPELQSATSIDGQPIRKIANLLASTDPRDDDDPMWIKMDTVVRTENGKFTVQGITYTTRSEGEYRFGVFDERALKAPEYIHKDVNFDGNPEGSSGLFSVLWDEKSNTVWVDTDQDHSFANERPLQDYGIHHDVGIFGSNKPAQPRRKSVGFVVQTDPEKKYVRITLGIWQHVTEVSGASVGKGFYGGSYDGVAPESQLETVFYAPDIFRLIESTIIAARAPNVDVICLEPSILDEVNNPNHDGRLVAGVIFDRLLDKYQKPILSPANNSAGMTTVVDEVSSRGVIAVGAYQSSESYRINNGATVANRDNLHLVGSFGPAGNGGLKPEIISPSEIISTDPGYKPAKIVKGVYEIPPGYEMAGGTSTAGPTASAAVALLISAAKQSKIRYDAGRIKVALLSTARFLPAFPAYKQGNGLIQVSVAWKMLQELDTKYDPVAIESHAPVRTELAEFLDPPFTGPGIFEREGWGPNQSGTRSITFRRTSGKPGPATFRLEWVGNDGAFQSADSLTLPLNQAVELPISIQTKAPGVYSAILNLKRPGYPGIAYQTLNTVVAADRFAEPNHFTVAKRIQAERPGTPSFFYRVDPGTPALRIHLSIPDKKPTIRVYALPPDLSTRIKWDNLGTTEKGLLDKVVLNPTPGVWEIVLWDNNFVFQPEQIDSNPLAPVPADLTVSALGVTAIPETWQLNPDAEPKGQEVEFSNGLAPFTGRSVSFSLGSDSRKRISIKEGQQQVYELQIPEGTEMLRASIQAPSDPSADLDMYLYQIVNGIAVLRAKSDGLSSTETIVYARPNAGTWKIVVSAFKVPTGSTEFSYEDAFFHPVFGHVEVDDKDEARGTGAKWKVAARTEIFALPTDGRSLVGILPVVPVAQDKEPLPSFPGDDPAQLGVVAIGYSRMQLQAR